MNYTKDNINIYYEIKGDGQPIILLHGWGQSLDTFNSLTSILKLSYKIYLIDLPGFGNSAKPQTPLSIPELSSLLNSFIADLDIQEPIILGHSYGGRIAIDYSVKYPNIKMLILMDSAGIKHFNIIKQIKKIKYKILKKYYQKTFQYAKYNKLIEQSGSTDYKKASPVLKQMLSKCVEYNQKKDLNKIKCPTLIIWGKKDNITKLRDAYILKRKVKKSSLVILNSNHFPYLKYPNKIADEIRDFIKENI